ncbi:MAG: FtsX-like permease family protein [Candidatus Marinimicrobia bacterium]|nr:FtsX-like permease family protein [Candidatus Neomarinimicrobiota bacterium]
MIKFLLAGILRDRSRSLFPILTVFIGTTLTVLMTGYIGGVMPDMIRLSAHLDAGHVKVTSQGYFEDRAQMPLDMALDDAEGIIDRLEAQFPDMMWKARTRFGGLLDIPDENGETRAQTAVSAQAADLISPNSTELEYLKIKSSLVDGSLPDDPFDIIVSKNLAESYGLAIGDMVTLMSSTVNGAMSFQNFRIAGTVVFGVAALDKGGAIIADIEGARMALDMNGGSTEILGFFKDDEYASERAQAVSDWINANLSVEGDPYSPTAFTMEDVNEFAALMQFAGAFIFIISAVFIAIMFIVLWNSGLMNGLRRYGEMGLRLAVGESKGHIYRSMLLESSLIGIIGTIFGTALGLFFVYLLQEYGLDISGIGASNTGDGIYYPDVIRGKIIPACFYIGFIPGLIAPFLGSLVSGRGIYKRQTASLFKELET